MTEDPPIPPGDERLATPEGVPNRLYGRRRGQSVVLAGDARLPAMLRQDELLPLGSRMRVRLTLEAASRDELLELLRHLLETAGNPRLMTPELMMTLCDHAVGNPRVLTTLAAELLGVAMRREIAQLDEKLYLEVFAPPKPAKTPRRPR